MSCRTIERAAPDEEVHAFVNELERPVGTYLYRTHVEPDFGPVQVRKLKEAADRDLAVGGARRAAQAIAAKLVDEYQLFVVPAVAGGGTVCLCYRPRR